ncbi:hypothetical protein [Azospirillum canadense]|uniref:hypothetical protein n=1 Tax=Azospirillum canadense TaxID=403962 RepID=UPI002225E6C2|nr:hypothetical protein [Azospirillum canadense]MCW2236371.1 hypothetical protein [Azospirillum canadense]
MSEKRGDEREGPMTTQRPQQSGDKPEGGKPAGHKEGRKAECDNTEFGQAAGAPGGRGGATPYGGIQRVKPRTER